ncbi:MAG: FixH family protein [Polyangiaceae bacterium]
MTTMTRQGWFWALFPVGVLSATAVSIFFVVSIALDDPGFSVEKDYYKKSSRFDLELAQRGVNEALGWKLEPALSVDGAKGTVSLTLRDSNDKPITSAQIEAEAFAVSRGRSVFQLRFTETSPGVYAADVANGRPGFWELRFTVQKGADRFTKTSKLEASVANSSLPAQPASPGAK